MSYENPERPRKVTGRTTVSSSFERMEEDLKASEVPKPDGAQRGTGGNEKKGA